VTWQKFVTHHDEVRALYLALSSSYDPWRTTALLSVVILIFNFSSSYALDPSFQCRVLLYSFIIFNSQHQQ
jgi:hypothetical protein